jgi:hypothetical protein
MLLVVHHGLLVHGEVSNFIWVARSSADFACRKGVPFTAMWLKFGEYDPQYDTDYINETANTASSIYFVTLVVM